MTHSARDCLERPRKVGARWSGRDIAPDEIIHDNRVDDWDSKRDRWDGYDAASYKRVVEEHEALEEARRKLREEQIDSTTDIREVQKMAKAGKKKQKEDADFGSSDESADEDDLKYAEAADVVGQKMDTKTRVTVRNLRIREDTAKYLINLDPER
jgi:pre-mRNA-processing factor SLU7